MDRRKYSDSSGCYRWKYVVIGAGSVVSKDIPDNTIVAGNPCKVIREITDEDRISYFKKQKFDDEAWEEVKNKNK